MSASSTGPCSSSNASNVHAFQSGRHLASWLGLTPKEHSSGSRRRMGRITKQGDAYLRTLLIHGARSALTAAQVRQRTGKPLSRIQQWAVKKTRDHHPNQAAVALANKMTRDPRGRCGSTRETSTAITCRRRPEYRGRTATTDHGKQKEAPYRGSTRRDKTHLMAERAVRRRGKADNNAVPTRTVAAIGSRCANHPSGPGRNRAPQRRPNIQPQPFPSAINTTVSPWTNRRSPYTPCWAVGNGGAHAAPWISRPTLCRNSGAKSAPLGHSMVPVSGFRYT